MNPKIKDMGKVTLTPKGEYNPEVPYEFLDLVVINPTGGCYVAKRDAPAGKIYQIVEGERVYVDDLDKYWVCVFDLRNGISGEVLMDNTVDNSKLKDLTIQGGPNGKIAENTITDFNIADDAILNRHIKAREITNNKIGIHEILGAADPAVSNIALYTIVGGEDGNMALLTIKGGENGNIALLTITGGQEGNIVKQTITDFNIADYAIVTRTIKNLNVTREKINNKSITGGVAGDESKIDNETITDVNIADNAVITRIIKDLNVTTQKINNRAVTTDKIAIKTILGGENGNIKENTITDFNLANDSVVTRHIKDSNVTRVKIENKAVDNTKIETKTILGGENGNVAFDTLTGGTEVNKGNIAPSTIHLYNINADICAGNIAEIDSWFTT